MSSLAPSSHARFPKPHVPFDSVIGMWKASVLKVPSSPAARQKCLHKSAERVSEAVAVSAGA